MLYNRQFAGATVHPLRKCCRCNILVTCRLPAPLLTFYKKICEISQKNRENPSRFTLGAGVKVTSKLLMLYNNEVRIMVHSPSAGQCINMQKRPSTMNKYTYRYSILTFAGVKWFTASSRKMVHGFRSQKSGMPD